MLQNKRKTIGVFAEKVKEEFQMRLCQGIIEEAELQGYNVAIFTNYGKYGQNNQHFIGDQMIWDLPCYEEFAGLILALDTMSEKSSRQKILDNVKKYCHCPVVSIREKVEGAVNFLVENTTGMAGLIRHFIELHGKKRLCFMSGPKTYWDARERMQCFLDTMKEYELPVTEHQMFYGDYWYNMGAQACDWFLAEDEMIAENQETEDWKKIDKVCFEAEILARESCGCMAKAGEKIILEKQREYDQLQAEQNRATQFDYMSIYLSQAESIEDIADYIAEFHKNMYGIRDYALCLCEMLHDAQGYKTYTDQMELCVYIKDNEQKTGIRIPFERRELLPEELISDKPQVWYFAPIHFQDNCYGYEAFQFWTWENTAKLFFRWNINIGNKIHDLLIEDKMKTLIDELAYMYDRDELTDWYNRRGLEKQGVRLLEQAKQEKSPLFLCVIDLDGMKQINDNFGHIEGDFVLKKVCETISGACRGEYLCARTGGDEFVVLAKNVTEMEGRAWMLKMEKELERFNKTSEKPYAIHASYGITSRVPGETESMQQYIKESDEKMYRYKVMNKKRRGEELR